VWRQSSGEQFRRGHIERHRRRDCKSGEASCSARIEIKAPLPSVCRNDSASGAGLSEFHPSPGAAKLFGSDPLQPP
jgi:hypothetical protein